MSFIALYITCKNREEADYISSVLLDKKMIACSNIFDIKSHYFWEQEKANDDETVCLVKSTPKMWESLQKEIIAIHSYDLPCIMKFDVEANEEYEKWIYGSVDELKQ